MSDAKFTKGPWEIVHEEEDGTIEIGMSNYLKNPAFYTSVHHLELYDCVWPEDEEDFEEAMANAHLIAASPDLYIALKACHLQMLQSNNQSEYAQEASQMAVAAIAKAEGR